MSLSHQLGRLAAQSLARIVPKRLMSSPRYFSVWEQSGYHVVPLYYESPIPPTSELRESLWLQPSGMCGIDLRDAAQLDLLDIFQSQYKSEYDAFPRSTSNNGQHFHLNNGWFEKVDAEILYSMVRHFRPRRIIEVGSGLTTTLSGQAIRRNQQDDSTYRCEFTAIEPFPVRINPAARPPEFKMIEKQLQDVPLSTFSILGEDDILFIDSSHVSRTGSDVNFEILEILPRLQRGVIVHFHDIFLPWEYPRSWVIDNHRFLNEQYILQAFLACNPDFEVVWASNYMKHQHAAALDRAFATFRIDITPPGTFLPGSFWIRRHGTATSGRIEDTK